MDETKLVVTKRQQYWSRMSGTYGTAIFEWKDADGNEQNSIAGVPLDSILDEILGDGTQIEMTLKVIKRKPVKNKNPWARK